MRRPAIGMEAGRPASSASVTAYRLGFLLRIPAEAIASRAGADLSIPPLRIKPLLDVTIGSAWSNVGDRIAYIDPNQADPLPRLATLGAGIQAVGAEAVTQRKGWQVAIAEILHLMIGETAVARGLSRKGSRPEKSPARRPFRNSWKRYISRSFTEA